MKLKRRWAGDMCFYCRLLDMRSLKDGRVVFWCDKRKTSIPDSFIWKRNCRSFVPVRAPEETGPCAECPRRKKGAEQN